MREAVACCRAIPMNIYKMMKQLVQALENLILGKTRNLLTDRNNFIHNTLTKQASQSENGMTIERLGPPIPYLQSNVALIIPRSTEDMLDLLAKFEEEKLGRKLMRPLAYLIGQSTMADMTGDDALKQRKIVTPIIVDIQGFLDISRNIFMNEFKKWANEKNGVVLLDSIKYTIRTVTAMKVFGKGLTVQENEEINHGFKNIKQRMLYPFSLKTRINFYKAQKRYRIFARQFIFERRDAIMAGLEKRKTNILSELLADKYGSENIKGRLNEYINKENITGAILGIAALDAVYTHLTGIFIQLLEQPHILQKIRAELDLVCTKHENGYLTISDAVLRNRSQLPYLDSVINEALRYISSAPIIPRYTKKGIKVRQFDIPAKSVVLISIKAMHYDAKQWGENVNSFNPERFMQNNREWRNVPYVPFSIGPRQCPGSRVGDALMKLFLAEFLLNYDVVAVQNQPEPGVDHTLSLTPEIAPGYRGYVCPRKDI